MTPNLTSPSENDVIQPLSLFEINYQLGYCYVTLVLLLTVSGVLGNSFIIYAMLKEGRTKGQAKGFIINIAIADLCVSGIADPMCVVGAVMGKEHLDNVRWFCVTVASLCLTACICVFLNLVNITINRWVFICHNHIYDRYYSRYTTLIYCGICWVASFMAELPNFVGWGGHYFDEKTHQCIWDRTADRSYTMFVALCLISAPFVVLFACHVAIFRKIYQIKKNICAFNRQKYAILRAFSTAKTLFAMFSVFLVCWTPYVCLLLLDNLDTYSMETHLLITLLAHSHSSTACFIYLAFNKKFRDRLRSLFGISNRVEPLQTLPHVTGQRPIDIPKTDALRTQESNDRTRVTPTRRL